MLPNLTPDLNNDTAESAFASTPINEKDFTVTITAGNKHFNHLAAAVVAWEYNHEHEPQAFDFSDEDEDDDEAEDEDDGSAIDYVVLQHTVTLNTIQEVNELIEISNSEEGEVSVSIVYHAVVDGIRKPVFRHTFTGYASGRAHLNGKLSSNDPLTFNFIVDCFRWSLTTLV